MAPLDMKPLRCTTLPPHLWRVQHNSTLNRVEERKDLVAALSNWTPADEDIMRAKLRTHIRGDYSQTGSPFLSLFDDRDVAMEWGKMRNRSAMSIPGVYNNVDLFKIDRRFLQDKMVFKVNDILTRINLKIGPDTAHEYLVLQSIPADAISKDVNISALEQLGEEIC